MRHLAAGFPDQLADVLHHLVGLCDRVADADILGGAQVLRTLATQEDHGAARHHCLGKIVVQPLFRIGLGGVERADAGVDHPSSGQAAAPAPCASRYAQPASLPGGWSSGCSTLYPSEYGAGRSRWT